MTHITALRDPATWRDVAYVVGLFVPLLALDTIVLAVWWASLAAITLPIWYWAPWQTIHGVRYHGSQLGYFPNGPHGPGGWGLYVDTLPKALAVAGVGLILFLIFNYVVVMTARAHAAVARGLLGASEDPLREAKEVLGRPGPLSSNMRLTVPPVRVQLTGGDQAAADSRQHPICANRERNSDAPAAQFSIAGFAPRRSARPAARPASRAT
jgi:hypothetical protein